MRLSLLGISISIFGIALILVSNGGLASFGLGLTFVGLLVSLIACLIDGFKKIKTSVD